jgi:3-hydroxybutyryl-CoA dehydratase
MQVNETYQYSFSFSQEQVEQFAAVTGDNNPIHLDKDYTEQSIFKQPILHGFLSGSVFSKVFGTQWPGQGCIYLRQDLHFLQPMYPDVKYRSDFKVLELLAKHRYRIQTHILDPNEKLCLSGEAIIQYRP